MAQPKLNPQFPKEEFFFDPFGLHPQEDTSSTASPQPPPRVNRLTRSNERKPTLTPDDVSEASKPAAKSAPKTAPKSAPKTAPKSASSPTTPALPPRLVVKFMAHEEVSSVAQAQTGDEGICAVYIEGKLSAQVTSSDAMKNLPFCVVATTPEEDHVQFKPNETYSSVSSRPLPQHALALIHVPKTEIAAVPIGTYSLTEQVAHMPLLVERKITMYGNTVRVALQVRSKLSNNGDMTDFTIAVAVPERVNGETIQVSRGNGVYDELKRTIKWSVEDLPKGESFMVSAQAQLWSSATKDDQVLLNFPVLLRCSSNYDQISNVELKAEEADGFPSTVSYSQLFSFRLLHRLP